MGTRVSKDKQRKTELRSQSATEKCSYRDSANWWACPLKAETGVQFPLGAPISLRAARAKKCQARRATAALGGCGSARCASRNKCQGAASVSVVPPRGRRKHRSQRTDACQARPRVSAPLRCRWARPGQSTRACRRRCSHRCWRVSVLRGRYAGPKPPGEHAGFYWADQGSTKNGESRAVAGRRHSALGPP
jgi:hypothetical protein